MQNLVVLMEPSVSAWNISMKGADMMLNRFCVDEDAAFEVSGVHYLNCVKILIGVRLKKGGVFNENFSYSFILQLDSIQTRPIFIFYLGLFFLND